MCIRDSPYDGEPLYQLGLSLKFQGKMQEAYDAFYKATWNGAWQDAAFYQLACIDSVSYKHLDVYKRQLHSKAVCRTRVVSHAGRRREWGVLHGYHWRRQREFSNDNL